MKKISLLFGLCILLSAFTCENEPLEGDFSDPVPDTSCDEASQDTAAAVLAFVNATDANYTELCNAYKSALEAQIAACGDDSGSLQALIDSLGDCINDQPTELVGTWKLTDWNGEEPIDLNNDGTESVNFLDEIDCYNNETLVFNNDNTGVAMSTSYADFDIFLEVGSTDTFDFSYDCVDEIENTDITWMQSGNIVSITDPFSTSDWTLNGNTLSITIPEGFTVINADDANVSVIQDLTFIYTKQ